jgi:hypothetical protein
MRRTLDARLKRLEGLQRGRASARHWIPILRYPWDLPDEAQADWLAEQLACACRPGCPGKRYGALVPAKAPTVEQWAQRARDYYQRRDRDAEP